VAGVEAGPSFADDRLVRLFQHAIFTVPNFSEGYCTDDNARAFILAVLLDEMEKEPENARTLATTYARFCITAFDPKTKRFHNHLSFDRRWLDERDRRTLTAGALGVGHGRGGVRPIGSFQVMSGQSSRRRCRPVTEFTSPRAWAFSLLGIHEYLQRLSGERLATRFRRHSRRD